MSFLDNSSLEQNPNCQDSADSDSPSVQWLTILLFLMTSSLLFVWLFEWDRYQIIAGPRTAAMSFTDKAVLVWLLAAKSLAWFLPWLLVWALFVVAGLRRLATVLVTGLWIAMFYFMAADLISVGFAGYHIWDYFPHIEDILASPQQHIWQWAGEKLTSEAFMILSIFLVVGSTYFVAVRWVTRRLVRRHAFLGSCRAVALFAAGFVFAVVAAIPAQRHLLDPILLDRIEPALPFTPGLKQSFRRLSECFATRPESNPAATTHVGLVKLVHASPLESHLVPFLSGSPQNPKFPEPASDSFFGAGRKIGEIVNQDALGPFSFAKKTGLLGNVLAGVSKPAYSASLFPSNAGDLRLRFSATFLDKQPAKAQASFFDQADEITALRLACDAADPGPADPSAFVTNGHLPNVILIIFESFRYSALGPGLMKKLDAWTKQGLRLTRHYSGSNCSHLGLFSLFYGRSALGYHQTLDRRIPAQMLESLRRSGYKITFLTAGEVKGFRRLDQFISDKTCDEVILDGEFTLKGMKDWPDSDRRKLARVRNIVNDSKGRPQFIFFYLVSSHYRYAFPPEFDIFKESPYTWQFLNPTCQIQNHLNRYANAALFLEDEVLKLVQSIDPKRNLILITGDHGESMGEDGVFTHGSRASEIQMRVPFAMVGPGVEPRRISSATVHTDILPTLLHALAGKSVSIGNCQGRDLIEESTPTDRVAVVPANGPEWEGLMVIRGNKRILFRTSADAGEIPSVEFAGLADEAGQYVFRADRGGHASGAAK
jgi:Sulfatase